VVVCLLERRGFLVRRKMNMLDLPCARAGGPGAHDPSTASWSLQESPDLGVAQQQWSLRQW